MRFLPSQPNSGWKWHPASLDSSLSPRGFLWLMPHLNRRRHMADVEHASTKLLEWDHLHKILREATRELRIARWATDLRFFHTKPAHTKGGFRCGPSRTCIKMFLLYYCYNRCSSQTRAFFPCIIYLKQGMTSRQRPQNTPHTCRGLQALQHSCIKHRTLQNLCPQD